MTEYHVPLSNPIKLKVHSFPLEKRTIILNYEPTVFPQGWSSRLMFFDQSHFKFTLNQTGDTSRVLDRGFWEPIAVKSHHVSFLTLWKLPTKYIAKALLSQHSTETHEDPPTNPHATPIVNDTDSPVCVLWDGLTHRVMQASGLSGHVATVT